MRRVAKTPEQLYIDWVSVDPNWLENMPLNKENFDRYLKTFDYALRSLNDKLGVAVTNFAEDLRTSPGYKTLLELSKRLEEQKQKE